MVHGCAEVGAQSEQRARIAHVSWLVVATSHGDVIVGCRRQQQRQRRRECDPERRTAADRRR